jgi:ABC-type multidrug transport system fused ATPase/permease subunit
MARSPSEDASGLPPLWEGVRRRYLTVLVGAGLGQAVVAGLGAHFVVRSLAGSSAHRGLLFVVLVAAAVAVGALRMVQRVVSEQLSQGYVHQIRLGLVRRYLSDGEVSSLGVAVARTTNDLSSVKSWISQGVAPLAVDIPLVVGAGVVLLLLDPALCLALLLPIMMLVAAIRLLTARGRLAGQVADTVLSTTAIRSAGGQARELGRVDRLSRTLMDAAVHRARSAGALRGLAATAAGLTTASVIGTGMATGLPAPRLAAALTVTGFLATPINDLGRVAEFRQTYRAARRIIGPAIEHPHARTDARSSAVSSSTTGDEPAVAGPVDGRTVVAEGVSAPGIPCMSDLRAVAGDRVAVDVGSDLAATELLGQLAALSPLRSGRVLLGGVDLATAGPRTLRPLVGYGARGMMLARASIARSVTYRSAESSAAESAKLLGLVGLDERVGQLPRGDGTMLTHGGEPLDIPERARLILARAMFGEPPLLLFDHLDADLGREGRARMREVLQDYPGVVIIASDSVEEVMQPTILWRPREQGLPGPVDGARVEREAVDGSGGHHTVVDGADG